MLADKKVFADVPGDALSESSTERNVRECLRVPKTRAALSQPRGGLMEDGHYVIGVIGNLIDWKHVRSMGQARWLFDWLVFRQTKPNGSVMGGMPIKDEFIQQQTGIPSRILKRWRETLRAYPYIKTTRTPYGTVYRVLKPKKYHRRQIVLELEENLGKNLGTKNGHSLANLGTKSGNLGTKNGQYKEDSHKTTIEADSQKPIAPCVSNELFPADLFSLPPWVPKDLWDEYVRMRKATKHPIVTDGTRNRAIRDLAALVAKGPHDVRALMEYAIDKTWRGFYPIPAERNSNGANQRGRQGAGAVPPTPGKKYREPTVIDV